MLRFIRTPVLSWIPHSHHVDAILPASAIVLRNIASTTFSKKEAELSRMNRKSMQVLKNFWIPVEEQQAKVGRAWTAKLLRRKSFEDLHKLYWVMVKERAAIKTTMEFMRSEGLNIAFLRERAKKVKLGIARLKTVVSQRQREHHELVAQAKKKLQDENIESVVA